MDGCRSDIYRLIQKGEGLAIEFKESRDGLSRNVFETVCAFLNRHGGNLFLGVSDAGDIVGIASEHTGKIKKEFVTSVNNPQKIHPACYLSVDEYEVEGKKILRIFVPESSQVHRCNGRIFDRNEDGDFDITDQTNLVAELYRRKQTTYSENRIYPHASLSDLRNDLIDRARKMAGIQRKDHPWLQMEDTF